MTLSNRWGSAASAGASAPSDVVASLATEAATDLGVDEEDLLFYFHPFCIRGANGLTAAASGGTAAWSANGWRTSSGAGGSYIMDAGNELAGPALSQFFKAGAAEKWWLASYHAYITGIAATSIMGVGARSVSAARILIGGHSTLQTNFTAYGDTGAVIDSGVAIDTGLRKHKFWRDGITSRYRVSAASAGVGTPLTWAAAAVTGTARPSANAGLYWPVYDPGSTRTIEWVWTAAACPRP